MRSGRGHGRIVTALLAALGALALSAGPSAAQDQNAVQQYAVRGGDTVYGDHGGACQVGFNARSSSGTRYGIVLGACAEGASTWYADAGRTVEVGTAGGGLPGPGTAALIRYTNPEVSFPGEITVGGDHVDITGSAAPRVGQNVCHAGRTSGLRCGVVQAVNVTIQFPDGIVYGAFRATDCAEPGDAGAPGFSGTVALGLVLGGSNCAAGGSAYHLPVHEVLSTYGLAVY
ncbi:S1 family peptidase [Streptomyces sp. DSM 42041]|uniref:S1 family peptidase n=1 Tax=Streptomyces hazeniae TaxID=3075538 RepID=A0ABU2NSH0_9ACTN|nr:S1 family peptidase [Streptomyces sp. DSM 42041]MDT0379934.1 S1 family peptidase [Streptomyces sp. DSM 42041]